MKIRIFVLIGGAVLLLVVALLAVKASPLGACRTLIDGSLGSPTAISGTLRESTPLLIAGLAVFVALRAGLFNIGVEGQLLVGAFASAAVGLRISGLLGLVLGVLAAMACGALWALPAAIIRAFRNGHEVITTIMLNSVAALFTTYLVAGPFKEQGQGEPTTALLPGQTLLPLLGPSTGVQLSVGLVLGVIVAGALTYWLQRTVSGFELRAVGSNAVAARYAGVDSKMVMVRAMLASGALAGLAGAVQVFGYEHRFYSGFSPGYGFDALGVALIAGPSALAVIPASLLFGILAKGGTALQIDGVPKGITTVTLGFLILIAAAIRYQGVRKVA